jgi:hypothetical protein
MSEKPSDTSTPQPPDKPTLLLDENLSSADIAAILRRLPNVWGIERHTDHLARGLSDVEVIETCGTRNWVLISCDDRIRFVPHNKAAVMRCGVRAFMFGQGNFQGVEYAAALIVGRKRIFDVLRKNAGPVLARIQISGDVVLFHPQETREEKLSSRERTKRKYGAHVFRENDDR